MNGGQGERAATSERLGDVAECVEHHLTLASPASLQRLTLGAFRSRRILKRTLCITLKSESTTAVASVQAVAQDAVTTLSTQLGNGFNVLQTKCVRLFQYSSILH